MAKMTLLVRNATTFTPTGELDEKAFAAFLQTLVDQGFGFYIASGASGEGHALTMDELRRVYEIGVSVGKGKVQVNANPPEQNTARMSIEHAKVAAKAGVDAINIYGPAAWHGFIPNDEEYRAYFDEILAVIKHPVALAPNPIIGYTPNPQVIADIANKYSQVVSINMSGQGDVYFIELKDRLKRDIPMYVQLVGSLNLLGMGAAGLLGAEANIIPETHRQYIDLYEAGKLKELAAVYADIRRFGSYVAKVKGSSPRWLKMCMRAFKMPGGEGGVRLPYLPEKPEKYEQFINGLLRLRIPEIDAKARAAGLTIPVDAKAR
ncbi:MAG TPA: dihydrodipicolinate synthase family protein [Bauldia sp.]|nr:dihydrodipicolinate synthase family protein [Bauldia sp.]